MIGNDVTAGNFFYCVNHWFPHQSKNFYNSVNSNDGMFHPYSYVIDGSCTAEFRDAENGQVVKSFELFAENKILLDHNNLPEYEKVLTENGVTVMFFSPIDITKPITVELKTTGEHDVVATDKRITIVSIIGPVLANDKELISMQYAAVFPGKTAKLLVPENGVCALVSYT